MYTTDSASGGLDGRRMAHPDGTPRVGPTSLAVFEQGQRGGQRAAETGKPASRGWVTRPFWGGNDEGADAIKRPGRVHLGSGATPDVS